MDISLNAKERRIILNGPVQVNELEALLSSFRTVYSDLQEWEIVPFQENNTRGEQGQEFIKPVMPDLDPSGSSFDLKEK